MSAVRLVTLVLVAGATCCLTVNPDTVEGIKTSLDTLMDEFMDLKDNINKGGRSVNVQELKENMEVAVRSEVQELIKRCVIDDSYLSSLQNNVLQVKNMMEDVKRENVEIKSKVEQYVGQNVSEEVSDVKSFVETWARNFSSTLQDVSDSVHLLTATPPPPPPQEKGEEEEEEEHTGPVYPCEDSTFPIDAEICPIAVKFKKCQLFLPSYHCCHTCTTNGQLPDMGPWRHMNLTREVTWIHLMFFFIS